MRQGSAYATGRGEILEYFTVDLPYWIVIASPDIHISTAWAYTATHISHPTSHISLKTIFLEHLHDPEKLQTLVRNDFEAVVFRTHEPMARLKRILVDAGAGFVQMSGSGSSVYGFFSDEIAAVSAHREIGKTCRTFLTPPDFQPLIAEGS